MSDLELYIVCVGSVVLMCALLACGFWMEDRIFAKGRKDRGEES